MLTNEKTGKNFTTRSKENPKNRSIYRWIGNIEMNVQVDARLAFPQKGRSTLPCTLGIRVVGGLGFGDLPVYYQVLAETSSDSPGSLELLPAGALRGALKPYIALSCWKLLWCLFFSCGDGQNHLC